MRKKVAIFFGIFLTLMLMAGVSAYAFTLQAGDFRLLFDDYDVFDDPVPDPLVPTFLGWTGGGATWSIADLTLAQKKDPITNAWQTYWTRGSGGLYYNAVVGSLALTPDPASPIGFREVVHGAPHAPDMIPPGEYVGVGPKPYPHNAYMTDLTGNFGYLRLYEHTADNWLAGVGEGPNIAGQGVFGTFAKTLIWGPDQAPGGGDDPTLVVDAAFNPFALAASFDLDAAFPGSPSGVLPSLFRSISNTSTQVGLIGWADVIGGSWQPQMDTNALFGLSDIRISADVYYLFDPQTGQWSNVSGWPSYSVGQIEGSAIPEPGTILLVGAGLLGVGFFARWRKK